LRDSNLIKKKVMNNYLSREKPVLGYIFFNWWWHLVCINVEILFVKERCLGEHHAICTRPPHRPPSTIAKFVVIIFLRANGITWNITHRIFSYFSSPGTELVKINGKLKSRRFKDQTLRQSIRFTSSLKMHQTKTRRMNWRLIDEIPSSMTETELSFPLNQILIKKNITGLKSSK